MKSAWTSTARAPAQLLTRPVLMIQRGLTLSTNLMMFLSRLTLMYPEKTDEALELWECRGGKSGVVHEW